MLRRLFLLLLLSGSALPALAQQPLPHEEDVVEEPQATSTAKKKPKRKKAKEKAASAFGLSLSLTHMGVFKGGDYPLSSAAIGGSYALDKNNKFSFNQGVTKYYEVEEDEPEVSPGDTLFMYSHSFGTESFSSSVRFDATLPVSKYSKRVGIYSKPAVRLLLGKALFDGALNVSVGPLARYYINQYKTAPVDESSGGDLLPRIEYGTDVGISVSGFSILSAGVSGSYSKVEYENSKYTNEESLKEYPLPDYHYSIGFFASVQFNSHMGLTAGVEQANEVNRYGGIEYVIFDREVTQWYTSLSFSF